MRARWYVIAWRLIWIVPVHVARALLCLLTLCGWGWRQARDLWEYTS